MPKISCWSLRPQDIRCRSKAEWLRARRNFIGGSDVPALVGCGYRDQSLFLLYDEKANGRAWTPSDSLLEKMNIGLEIEPVIRRLFKTYTSTRLLPDYKWTIRVHESVPCMGVTIDGGGYDSEHGYFVAELKNVGAHNAHQWDGDEAPLNYEVQLQTQLACTGCEWGVLVALIGGERLVIRWRHRDDRFIAAIEKRCQEFWEQVQAREAPLIEPEIITTKLMAHLHPSDNGECVSFPAEVQQIKDELVAAMEARKELDGIIEQRKATIQSWQGDATYGAFPDGSCVSWRTQETRGYTVEPRTARVFRVMQKLPKGLIYDPDNVVSGYLTDQTAEVSR